MGSTFSETSGPISDAFFKAFQKRDALQNRAKSAGWKRVNNYVVNRLYWEVWETKDGRRLSFFDDDGLERKLDEYSRGQLGIRQHGK